jgi:hypothetical protein
MKRKPFIWVDPETEKKHRMWTTPDIVNILENVIESEDQAEDFFNHYERVSQFAEQNIGYFAGLIKDTDIREDVLDLFMVDPNIEIHQVFGPDSTPWGSSLGRKVIDNKIWTNDGIKELKKAVKK